MEILGIGAEAILVKTKFYDFEVVRKTRVRKAYRDATLDSRIRSKRTILEAKLLAYSKCIGVPVPTVLYVDAHNATIIIDYIKGKKLRDILDKLPESDLRKIFHAIGREVGLLHRAGIVHGDLTTSNMIVSGGKVFLIDFGLGYFSKELEDRAVDIHLFLRALESTHPNYVKVAFDSFVRGYREIMGEYVDSVLNRVKEIRLRGRYVGERRKRKYKERSFYKPQQNCEEKVGM